MTTPDLRIVDGCTAATYVAYALSEVATVYPITPIAEMGQLAQLWGMKGVRNVWGQRLDVREMESELGAAGATHGALAGGALATTFTNSQGLVLMMGNMFKMSGQQLPAVFHVGCRSLSTHALSIFGDHQDVMAMRTTDFAMLASNSVQDTVDLGIVAHLAAIEGSLPVLHFFDGWRTSNEMSTVTMPTYDEIARLVDQDAVRRFRAAAMSPNHPDGRGSCEGSDVYFQNREAVNTFYTDFPGIVEKCMQRVGALTGRSYNLFDYVGDPDAEYVTICIGSACDVIEETLPVLQKAGIKAGMIKVRLYRPFAADRFLAALPKTAKVVAVLNRTKEPGAGVEPLTADVATAFQAVGLDIKVLNGRYGLSSKEFDPDMVEAVYTEMQNEAPKRDFTVGIDDDVTHLSLAMPEKPLYLNEEGMTQAIFYGLGADGMVGATKQVARIIQQNAGKYVQVYFNYSAKKSGGYTISQLRIADRYIRTAYGIKRSDLVACSKANYVERFDMLKTLKPGGIFLINSSWSTSELMTANLPAKMRRTIAAKNIRLYNIDATQIADAEHLGTRVNMVMETAFFRLTDVMPFDKAVEVLKADVKATYGHEGPDVVNENITAIDNALSSLTAIDVPADWASAQDTAPTAITGEPSFITRNSRPCLRLEGDMLPVSAFNARGVLPAGTTAYERRKIAIRVPAWDADKCVQCTECSLVCSHAAIRPYLLTADEKAKAPAAFNTVAARGNSLHGYEWRIQVFADSCTGCGSCATVCPGQALSMVPLAQELDTQVPLAMYATEEISPKDNVLERATVRGSQMRQPLFEFSGACGGCGETPYIKLLTQLFGERLLIANATGCSSVYGLYYPSNPYCKRPDGRGPAWANSLFEDNAEFAFGILAATAHRHAAARQAVVEALGITGNSPQAKQAMEAYIAVADDPDKSADAAKAMLDTLDDSPRYMAIKDAADALPQKTVWAVGGDGWAYDIGFAGLDHVLAQNKNINILVLDTECYSNTGGQMSKATPVGAVAKYAPGGKRTVKKDLGRMMMTYGDVYVASIALGANYQQAIDALTEAEAYPGASIVIAYCPCINHGIRAGMATTIVEQRRAVEAGYWQLYRYNPAQSKPLTIDLPASAFNPDAAKVNGAGKYPVGVYRDFVPTAAYDVEATNNNLANGGSTLLEGRPNPVTATTFDATDPQKAMSEYLAGEDRYADLATADPTGAKQLQADLEDRCRAIYDLLARAAQ